MYLSFTVYTYTYTDFHNYKYERSHVYEWTTSFLMITDKFINEMPFRDVTEITTLDNEQNNEVNSMYNMSTNNDFLVEIDPDHNIFQIKINGVKKCSNYDTSVEFNKTVCSISDISLLHLNIFSSQHKLTDLSYYLENLNVPFSFIGIRETWATKFNNHILNIPTHHHEQCLRSNNK